MRDRMQVIIEIDDKTYKDIKEENSIYGINNGLSVRITGKVIGAIQNGTPLPKGHGRLIDADEIQFENAEFDTYGDYCRAFDAIDQAEPIIEADKEQEDD